MERCPIATEIKAERCDLLKVWAATNNIFLGLPTSFLVSNLNCNFSPPVQTRLRKNFDTIKESFITLTYQPKNTNMGVSLNGGTPPPKKKKCSFFSSLVPMVVGETHHFRKPPITLMFACSPTVIWSNHHVCSLKNLHFEGHLLAQWLANPAVRPRWRGSRPPVI